MKKTGEWVRIYKHHLHKISSIPRVGKIATLIVFKNQKKISWVIILNHFFFKSNLLKLERWNHTHMMPIRTQDLFKPNITTKPSPKIKAKQSINFFF